MHSLSIASLDCDAFYASVEKRDDPRLRDKPVIVGGGRRGVVSTACYIARIRGVHSAMPMFKALRLCPDAVVIRPDMDKYVQVGRDIRELMRAVSPIRMPKHRKRIEQVVDEVRGKLGKDAITKGRGLKPGASRMEP